MVLDPDSEYEPLITLLGGSYVDLAETLINPLAVGHDLPIDEAAEVVVTVLSILGGDTVAYVGGRPVRRLPGEDKAWLHGQVASFLTAHGAGDAEPLLGDLVDGLRTSLGEDVSLSDIERDRYRRIALRLSGYTRGSLGRIFNRPGRLQIDGQAPVGIGFRSLSLRYAADLTPALAVVLAHVLGVLNRPHRPLIVLVDEAHVLTADPDAGQVLEQLVRRARKSGAGVWMASQRIEEFVSTDLGRTLASTAATKLVLGHEETVAAQVPNSSTSPTTGRGTHPAGGRAWRAHRRRRADRGAGDPEPRALALGALRPRGPGGIGGVIRTLTCGCLIALVALAMLLIGVVGALGALLPSLPNQPTATQVAGPSRATHRDPGVHARTGRLRAPPHRDRLRLRGQPHPHRRAGRDGGDRR